jgi:hypothetical protein
VKYNNVSLTQVRTTLTVNTSWNMSGWYLNAPATGTNNVVITIASSNNVYGVSTSYTNVKQTSQPEATAQVQDTLPNASITVTTVSDNALVVVFGSNIDATFTAGADSTVLTNGYGGGGVSAMLAADSPKTPAGSRTVAATVSGGTRGYTFIGMALAPAPPDQKCSPHWFNLRGKTLTLQAANFALLSTSGKNTWAGAHDASVADLISSNPSSSSIGINKSGGPSYGVSRTFANFNTAIMPTTAQIKWAKLRVYGASKNEYSPGTYGVYGSTASDVIVDTDFDLCDTTALSDTTITNSAWPSIGSPGWVEYPLNAAGLLAIVKGGISKFCLREGSSDIANTAPTDEGNWVVAMTTSGVYAIQLVINYD